MVTEDIAVRRILIALAAVAVMSSAIATVLFTVPEAIEKSIEWTCSLTQPTDRCVVRMRAMGHVWSRKGDLARAETWYRRAADHGDAASMFHLAWIYEKAGQADLNSAFRRMTDEARIDAPMEDPEAAKRLLSQANLTRAAEWYRKSADKGFAPAMNNLGELYGAGMGVQQDAAAAFRWHMAGARAGNPVAAMNTALDFRVGRGVTEDSGAAEKWSSWTGRPGTADLADPTLERTLLFGSSIPPNERARFRAAAEQGVPVKVTMKPLTPSPALPTFRQVQEQLRK